MEIADSARKHGVSDEDVEHATRNAIVSLTNDSGEKVLLIGPALDGRFLEVVVLDPDDDPVAIHAMNCRPRFYRYLER